MSSTTMFKPTKDDYVRVIKKVIWEKMCEDTRLNPNDYDDEHINQVLDQQGIKINVGDNGYSISFNHS